MIRAEEYNFDGLIGPTHHYGGLALGNVPSAENKFAVSNPRDAALQGLEKIKQLLKLGVKQGIIPPQERPNIQFLKENGFSGNDQQILEKAAKDDLKLLLSSCSSASMWTANAATVSPSADAADHKVHFTTANLISQKHRAIEASQTHQFLKKIFSQTKHFFCHRPLDGDVFADEGAANHLRLCPSHGDRGVEVFVYGKSSGASQPKKYPARQSREASEAVARNHQLLPDNIIFAQQNPAAIDLGVFHNDLIAVSNENVLLFHESAFVDTGAVVKRIGDSALFKNRALSPILVTENQLSAKRAVESFFFNSQIVTRGKSMALIAPAECQDKPMKGVIDSIIAGDNPVSEVHFVNLRESMRNGGGPACLRLRVVLTKEEAAAVHQDCLLDEKRIAQMEEWVKKHYRDRLHVDDFRDIQLLKESRTALDHLTQILNLGSIYPFQRT